VIEYELLPEGATPKVQGAYQLVWPSSGGDSGSVRASLDPWLSKVGNPSHAAVDLTRIAAGAFVADRLQPRRQGFSRTIRLYVQLVEPSRWEGLANEVADLLHWLTGDAWYLELSADDLEPPSRHDLAAEPIDEVALLSGGLDSLCGAVLGSQSTKERLFLSHWDNTIVKGAQDRVYRWLGKSLENTWHHLQVWFSHSEVKREASSRSRAFLFMALAVAAADARGAVIVEVPENGFTSLNPPLGPDRGGALSTRSTHPWTIEQMNWLLDKLGLTPRVRNAYMWMTKGELVAAAGRVGLPSFASVAAETLSCGKLDGRIYRGGNPNHHCGLCVPCLVRRGAFVAAGIHDATPYLCEYLTGKPLQKLLARRQDDVSAVQLALEYGIDDVRILALGPFPQPFGLDAATDLCARGLEELRPVLDL